MNQKRVTIIDKPTVIPLFEMRAIPSGLFQFTEWLAASYPECQVRGVDGLWSHADEVSDNERLVEFAGRNCYKSFGAKAGRKSNSAYIENTQGGEIPHASIMYHAKFSFFVAGISRRVSHELIRHYVGADRDEEGSPSQESTRYVDHPGVYVSHPGDDHPDDRRTFELDMQSNYDRYCLAVSEKVQRFRDQHGKEPKGLDRKRIREACSARLSHAAATSFVWTTNPVALAKLLRERLHEAADLEFQRLAQRWARVAVARWPNLFGQSFLQDYR